MNTLTRHLKTVHKISRKVYLQRYKESMTMVKEQLTKKLELQMLEEKFKKTTVPEKQEDVQMKENMPVPLEVPQHDKITKKIRVMYSDGSKLWVNTSMLLKDDELQDKFRFYLGCEKSLI